MAQARPEIRTQVRLDLGKVHLELMYYADGDKNAHLAIEQFEWVLERSKKKEELVDASNCKTQTLWWKHVTGPGSIFFAKSQEFPLRTWAKSVATIYKDDTTAVCYYAMSNYWICGARREDLTWFDMVWCLSRSRHQSPPPAFHFLYFVYARYFSNLNSQQDRCQFRDLSFLISALEHLTLFAETATLKDIDIIQRCVIIPIIETSIAYLNGTKVVLSPYARI
jgi:hypothetical protein